MYAIEKNSEEDDYAKASVGALGAATAGVIGTKTIVGGAILNGLGHVAGVKVGAALFTIGAGTCAAPVILVAAGGYLAVKGIVRLFK